MAAPCINDTCSITSLIDPITRRLELNARVDPAGGLQCVDGAGLGIEVYGSPANAAPIDTCYQQLGISASGQAWSIPKRAQFRNFGSSANIGIPQNANEGNWTTTNPIDTNPSMDNPFSCSSMMLVFGRMRIRYVVGAASDGSVPADNDCLATPNGAEWVPFNADLNAEFRINNIPVVSLYPDTSGIMRKTDVQSNESKDNWFMFSYMDIVGGGATVALEARARHVGPDGQFNVNTSINDSGLACNGTVIFLPFNGENF